MDALFEMFPFPSVVEIPSFTQFVLKEVGNHPSDQIPLTRFVPCKVF